MNSKMTSRNRIRRSEPAHEAASKFVKAEVDFNNARQTYQDTKRELISWAIENGETGLFSLNLAAVRRMCRDTNAI